MTDHESRRSTSEGGGGCAVLFWFYKDLLVCRNRLDLLRRHNPNAKIFGLYGGDPASADRYREALEPQLDDFYAYDRVETPKWKWRHGDLMLAAWYEARGRHLQWDHVFVAQWDMLVLAPLPDLLPPLADDEVLLSAVRSVAALEPRWVWSRGGHEPEYRAFIAAIESQFGAVEPICCVFVIACLPRRLLDAYGELADPETGYIEYRLPTLASLIGLHVVEDDDLVAWQPADGPSHTPSRRERLLNGSRRPILLPVVFAELARRRGARVFHPYHGLYPQNAKWAALTPAWAFYAGARAARAAVAARVKRLARHGFA